MRTHRSQLISSRRGNVIRLVREHYLREDIDSRLPCHSDNVFTTEDCQFVISLDADTILNQIDALQHEKFTNVLILQTVYDIVQKKSRAIQKNLDKLLSTPEKHFMLFANEHCINTYVEQENEMTSQENHDKNIVKALNFLNEQFPIKYIVNFDKDVQRLQEAEGQNIKFEMINVHEFAAGDEHLEQMLSTTDTIAENNAPLYDEYMPVVEVQKLYKEKKVLVGFFTASQRDHKSGEVNAEKHTVFIQDEKSVNRALDGDKVAVLLNPESEWVGGLPTGKVVNVLSHKSRVICGTVLPPKVQTNDWQSLLVVPQQDNLPKIRIRTRQTEQLIGMRVHVAIDSWSVTSKYPAGHYISTIGQSGDLKAESEVILMTNEIPHDSFSAAVLDCLPKTKEKYQPSERELAGRYDYRDRLICSIDPPGCTDIDDALHYRDIDEDTCEIGVHIADVSNFVLEGSAMDLEARDRGTTVYLVDKRIHMLPSLLSENLCSLMENVERLAFSVVCKMDKKTAEPRDIVFGKSIIRSTAALSYGQAQNMVDGVEDHSLDKYGKEKVEKLTYGIKGLLALSRIMNKKRMDAGALTLSSPQLHFTYDSETFEPLTAELYEHHEVNSLVEEFMLFANIEVAKKIYNHFSQSAMLRRHESPIAARFDFLNRALKRFGIQLDPESNKSLVETLDSVKGKVEDLDNIVRIMTTRCMQFAKYFASGTQTQENFKHFGLATPIYTHFTSPIRRYADLIVHRQLAEVAGFHNWTQEDIQKYELDHSYLPRPSKLLCDKNTMESIAENLNYRHKMAQDAGRASSQLFMMEMLRKTPGRVEEGKVIKVKPTVFVVLLEQYGVEGHVHVEGDQWAYNETEETLENGDKKISIFDTIKVKVNVTPINMHGRSRLDLELVE